MKLKLVNIGSAKRDLSDDIFLRNGEKEISDNKEKEKLDLSFGKDFPIKRAVFRSDYLIINKNKNKILIRILVENDRNFILYAVYLFEIDDNRYEREIEDILSTIKEYTSKYNRKIVDEEKTLETLKEELSKIHDKEIKKGYISNGLIGAGIIVALATYLSAKNIPLSLLGVLIIVIGIVNKFKK